MISDPVTTSKRTSRSKLRIAQPSVDPPQDRIALAFTVPAADDFQFDFTTPGGDAIDGLVQGVTNGLNLFDESAAEVVLTSGSLESVDVSAIVVMAAGAGTIQMRAAKNADAGADGTFHIGSHLELRRLDV